MRRKSRSFYREPAVTLGEPKPMPEARPEVVAMIVERLEKGAFLQQYSNGEFTSSSIAVARSFEKCKNVQVLECAGYTVHHDVTLAIFWRRGGSFD